MPFGRNDLERRLEFGDLLVHVMRGDGNDIMAVGVAVALRSENALANSLARHTLRRSLEQIEKSLLVRSHMDHIAIEADEIRSELAAAWTTIVFSGTTHDLRQAQRTRSANTSAKPKKMSATIDAPLGQIKNQPHRADDEGGREDVGGEKIDHFAFLLILSATLCKRQASHSSDS